MKKCFNIQNIRLKDRRIHKKLPVEHEINHTNSINTIHLNSYYGYKEDMVRAPTLFGMTNLF